MAFNPFVNPVLAALDSIHRHFAMIAGSACKYPADVAPFAAIASNDEAALRQLHSLLVKDERTSLIGGTPPLVAGLTLDESLQGVQMIAPAGCAPALISTIQIVLLTERDVPAMVALTTLAFPGYFRTRTCEMGRYYGIREGNSLIAMAGERIAFGENREISGVCTHPKHTGRGYAARLVSQLMQDHADSGLRSFLHTAEENHRAIGVYERLGFSLLRQVVFHRVRRTD